MTTFGEIVEPISRTAWEDWDEITPDRNNTVLLWHEPPEQLSVIDALLIFEGNYLSDVIKGQTGNKLKLINFVPQVNLKFYNIINTHKYVCLLKEYDLIFSSEIVELLKPYISTAKEVIAIQTKTLNDYKTTEHVNHNCIIRKVCTTNYPRKLDMNYKKLEQPNIVAGVSAGVVSLREHMDLNGIVLVCYMEYPEEYQIEEVGKLLEKLNITPVSHSKVDSVLYSNLYL